MPKGNEFKFPKTLAQCADLLYETREARLAIEKQAEELKKREALLKDHLINELPKSQAGGIAGKVARVTITTKLIPQVKDWDSFRAYIKKTGSWDLIQKRVSDTAVKERWEAGKEIPGVEAFQTTGVSINKV